MITENICLLFSSTLVIISSHLSHKVKQLPLLLESLLFVSTPNQFGWYTNLAGAMFIGGSS